jgi:hypothetical protein
VPLSNTRIIHRLWRPHHEPAVHGTMTALVRLSKPAGLGSRNATTGATPLLEATRYYEGPGRVQARGGANPADSLAEREVDTAPYLVAVPVDLGEVPERGDLVDVLEADDPLLVGLRLYVTEVPKATVILQRNLGCDEHPPTMPGG